MSTLVDTVARRLSLTLTGAQTGTTSLTAIRETVKPSADPLVFDDTAGPPLAVCFSAEVPPSLEVQAAVNRLMLSQRDRFQIANRWSGAGSDSTGPNSTVRSWDLGLCSNIP